MLLVFDSDLYSLGWVMHLLLKMKCNVVEVQTQVFINRQKKKKKQTPIGHLYKLHWILWGQGLSFETGSPNLLEGRLYFIMWLYFKQMYLKESTGNAWGKYAIRIIIYVKCEREIMGKYNLVFCFILEKMWKTSLDLEKEVIWDSSHLTLLQISLLEKMVWEHSEMRPSWHLFLLPYLQIFRTWGKPPICL